MAVHDAGGFGFGLGWFAPGCVGPVFNPASWAACWAAAKNCSGLSPWPKASARNSNGERL